MKKFNMRGDTIVEVMIAIIVLGAATGGAFAIANSAQRTTQANHERYQAQLYANQQAERLRLAYAAHMDGGGTRAGFATVTTPSGGCLTATNTWTSGVACTNDIYTIKVSAVAGGTAPAASAAAYSIEITWDRIGGGKDNVELVYGV